MSVVWNVVQIERNLPDGDTPPNGLVTTLHWTAQFSETSCYGSIGLGEADPDNYTPYVDITEAQAVEWAQDALGTEKVIAIESGLTQQKQKILNPTTGKGVPW